MSRNILLCVPSLYRKGAEEIEYPLFYSPETRIKVRHTNMPVFCSISKHLKKKDEQIDAVFLLSSKEVRNDQKNAECGEMTTEAYLQTKFCSYQKELGQTEAEIVSLNVPEGELRNTSSIQSRIDEHFQRLNIDYNTKIWVDFTSGQRSYAILLVFLLRFLELSKCGEVAEVLYAKLLEDEKKKGKIESCLAVYRLFDSYGLLERISAKPSKELIESDRESVRQREINQVFQELNKKYNELQKEALNTSGSTSEVFSKAIKEAQEYAEQYPDVPMIREMAKRIQDVFSAKEDVLASSEYLLNKEMPGLAMIKLRENAFRHLIVSGVIKTERPAAVIEAEVMSATRYYETFLKYMIGCLNQLLADFENKPIDMNISDEDKILINRYDMNVHKQYEKENYKDLIAAMNEAVQGHFRENCQSSVYGIRLKFAQEVHELSTRRNAPHGYLEEYERIRYRYNEKEEILRHIYQMSGFPLPCFNQSGSYYYHTYQKYLVESAKELIRLLDAKRNGWSIPDDFRYICLPEKDLASLNYREVIKLCLNSLRELVPLRFSYQFESGERQGWTCGLKEERDLQMFLIDYLPLHNQLREERNDFAHPDETRFEPDPSLSLKQQTDIVMRCVQALRDVESKERR